MDGLLDSGSNQGLRTAELIEVCDQVIERRKELAFWDVCRAYVMRSFRMGDVKGSNAWARRLDVSRQVVKLWRNTEDQVWETKMKLLLDRTTVAVLPVAFRSNLSNEDWRWIAEQLYAPNEINRRRKGRFLGPCVWQSIIERIAVKTPGRKHLALVGRMTYQRHKARLESSFRSMRDEGLPADDNAAWVPPERKRVKAARTSKKRIDVDPF